MAKVDVKSTRNSSIELLKILAMFIIAISHTQISLSIPETYYPIVDYLVDINASTTDVRVLCMSVLQNIVIAGNTTFFICSAWFLVDSKGFSGKKFINMLIEIWVVSVIILAVVYCFKNGEVDIKLVIRSLFPTTFSNNWYMTCYLLFYATHQYINKLINMLNKTQLLRVVLSLSALYIFVDFFHRSLFFCNALTEWLTIYFLISYVKKYHMTLCDNRKFNLHLFLIGLLAVALTVIAVNYVGLYLGGPFQNQLLHFRVQTNPFVIMFTMGLFNIFRTMVFHNKTINYISSLTMLIYIIHDNILIRSYYRPMLWHKIYITFGYDHLFAFVILLALGAFLFGLLGAILFKTTIGKVTPKVSSKVLDTFNKYYYKVENYIISH